MMSHTYMIESLKTKDFFETHLKLLVSLLTEEMVETNYTFCFIIDGIQGGIWTIDFGKQEIRPRAEKAQVLFQGNEYEFNKLINGKFDMEGSYFPFRIEGNMDALRFLGYLLQQVGKPRQDMDRVAMQSESPLSYLN